MQASDKASHHRSCLNKAVKASVLCRFAWSGDDEQRYGGPAYYMEGDELLADPDQQSYFYDREQLSPYAAFCRMFVFVFWLADSCALCLS